MAERDVISWNTVIGVFSVNGLYEEAFVFFNNMNSRSGTRPNTLSVISVLPVCAGLEDEVMASQIHAYTVKVGLVTNVTVGNALVDAYAKCGNAVASRHFFDEMVEKNVVSRNAIIMGFAYGERNGIEKKTVKLQGSEKAVVRIHAVKYQSYSGVAENIVSPGVR